MNDPAKNRFTTASGTAYNDNGQVVTDGKFRNLGYGYDANGRMVRASQANVTDAVQVYDALGNRVAEKVNDVWQFVIYDAFGKMVAEYGGNPQQDEGGVKYYMQDWQGSVRAGVNAGGFVRSRTDHQAFGEDIASGVGLRTTAQGFGAPHANRQGYGLTEKDSATGLNHTWFRKNENRAGRWTSPDPYNGSASVGNPQSWNRYSYVENEPTNYVDPTGLVWYVCQWWAWFRYPEGFDHPESKYQEGAAWLRCWVVNGTGVLTVDNGYQEVSLNNGGRAGTTPENDPLRKKELRISRCITQAMYPILKSANDQQTAENQKAFNDMTFSQTVTHGSGAMLTGAAIVNEVNPAMAGANVLLIPPTFGGHAYLAKKNTDITAMINTNNFVDQLRKVVADCIQNDGGAEGSASGRAT